MARPGAEDLSLTTTAVLRGSESQIIGAVSAISEASAAISLSQGGYKKLYPHTDPNEDAAAFALGEAGVLLAVADGHNGCDASATAIDELLLHAGRLMLPEGNPIEAWWQKAFLEVVGAIQNALVSRVVQGVRGHSRTTLALALVLPRDGVIAFGALGDSHIFRVCPEEVVDIGAQADELHCFLGNPADDLGSLARHSVTGIEPLANTSAIVLATDGISEAGIGVDLPEFTISESVAGADRSAPELRPLEVARTVTEAALAAHRRHRSGDNIATAVTCLPLRAAASEAR